MKTTTTHRPTGAHSMQTRILLIAATAVSIAATASLGKDYRMTTPMPPGVASPDKVETRLGTLRFFDGFPDKATAEKCYDNLDFQRGVQAYLAALPANSVEALRRGITGFGPANQTVLISETLLDSKSLFLTANDNTVYTLVS